eukprot:Hpha_TRINITY_DN8521_c0_g1::TRINITY_DN8521_c0_g1_i1::g.146465::m.146465
MSLVGVSRGRIRPSDTRGSGVEGFGMCPAERRSSEADSDNLSYLSAASGQRMECICEICDCGGHRCPVHAKVTPYGPLQTNYTAQYPAHKTMPRHCPPPAAPVQTTAADPDHFETVNNRTFTPHPITVKRARPQSAPPARNKFRGRTTYQTEHYARDVNPMRRRPPQYTFEKVPFDADTVNRTTYAHPGQQAPRGALGPQPTEMVHVPFNGESTYKALYQGGTPDPVRRYAPQQVGHIPDDRDFKTTKHLAFSRPGRECYDKPESGGMQPLVQVSPYGPIQSRYRQDYPEHPLQPRHKAPGAAAVQSTAADPDHFATTNLQTFRPHSVEPRRIRPQSAPPARTKFRGTTTYQQEHYARPVSVNRRRPPQYTFEKVPFDATTTHRDTYAGHEGAQRQLLRPTEREIGSCPFNGTSTYREHYEDRPAGPLTRPAPREVTNVPEDRDFRTTKGLAYTPHALHVCPAAHLPRKKPSRHTGHVHYHRRPGFGTTPLKVSYTSQA